MSQELIVAVLSFLTAFIAQRGPLMWLLNWFVPPGWRQEEKAAPAPQEGQAPPSAQAPQALPLAAAAPAGEVVPAPPIPAPGSGWPGVVIIGHSMIFYWWPLWMLGFLFAALTYWDNGRLAVLPAGSRVQATDTEGEYKLVLPKETSPTQSLKEGAARSADGKEAFENLAADTQRPFGTIFFVTLVVIIAMTNVPLRGMWSVVAIILIVVLAVLLSLTGALDRMVSAVGSIGIQINPTGYLFLAIALFTLWVTTLLFTDRQRYLLVTSQEVIVCTGMSGQALRFPASGVAFEGQRSDLFLNWVLGLGSGDLTMRAGGQEFHFPNVLFIGRKLRGLAQLLGPGAVKAAADLAQED